MECIELLSCHTWAIWPLWSLHSRVILRKNILFKLLIANITLNPSYIQSKTGLGTEHLTNVLLLLFVLVLLGSPLKDSRTSRHTHSHGCPVFLFEHCSTHPPSSSVLREHMLGALSLCPLGPMGLRPLPACLVCLFMTRANWTGLTDGPLKLRTG